jgi:DNA-binding Lrp family transcriptional regulator
MMGEITRIPRKTYLQKIKELGLDLPEDRRLLYMSALGMSNRAMRAHLGLSNGQITYRLKKWREAGYLEANRMTWRDGTGRLAKQAILKIDYVAEMEITREIERNLPRFLLK